MGVSDLRIKSKPLKYKHEDNMLLLLDAHTGESILPLGMIIYLTYLSTFNEDLGSFFLSICYLW